MEAIKTEYKGIIFRSKSEAQLAFMFDNSCLGVTGWIYEPKKFKLESEYTPDFLLFLKTTIYIVEYKPIEPTLTYFNEFKNKYNRETVIDPYNLIEGAILLFGSVYAGGIFQYFDNNEHKRIDAFDISLMQKAKNYRFDLKQ
jgi:hypothetical protein